MKNSCRSLDVKEMILRLGHKSSCLRRHCFGAVLKKSFGVIWRHVALHQQIKSNIPGKPFETSIQIELHICCIRFVGLGCVCFFFKELVTAPSRGFYG